MSQVITCAVLFVVNTLVILLAHLLFPHQVVLGTWCVSYNWALIHSGFVLGLIDTFSLPFLKLRQKILGRSFTKREWFIAYFIINFIGLWVIARFPNQFGFGISSWLVVLILSFLLTPLQNFILTKTLKLW